jgi:lipopolysaccharide export system protein LptC
MTADPGLADVAGSAPAGGRRAAEMERWRKRSARIALYRKALPFLMIGIVVAVVGWVSVRAVLSSRQQAQTGSAELRMTNPKFYGRDERGRSFQLTAREAVRSTGDADQVSLIAPAMRLDVGGANPMSVDGGHGTYREDTKVLRLDGGVRMKDGRGTDLTSPEAVVDTQANVVKGEKGVEGQGPLGRITASSYAIYDGGDRLVFSGGVRSRLEQK